jgi:hypothetical protein
VLAKFDAFPILLYEAAPTPPAAAAAECLMGLIDSRMMSRVRELDERTPLRPTSIPVATLGEHCRDSMGLSTWWEPSRVPVVTHHTLTCLSSVTDTSALVVGVSSNEVDDDVDCIWVKVMDRGVLEVLLSSRGGC